MLKAVKEAFHDILEEQGIIDAYGDFYAGTPKWALIGEGRTSGRIVAWTATTDEERDAIIRENEGYNFIIQGPLTH